MQLEDVHRLTDSELIHVYKTFAMPRQQRHKHPRYRPHNSELADEQMPDVGTEDIQHIPMDIEHAPPAPHDLGDSHVRSTQSPVGEKRRPSEENLIDDCHFLSKATKRIKISASPEFALL